MLLEGSRLELAKRAESVQRRLFSNLICGCAVTHISPITGPSMSLNLVIPNLVLVFTVPSGWPRRDAISLWLKPE